MTPVQSKVLHELPDFRSDCLVQAKTGTGKTIAFLLPALHCLVNGPPLRRGQVGILVMSPTRELAMQIAKECQQLITMLPSKPQCYTIFGGTHREASLRSFIEGNPAIVIATPGRLNDILGDEYVRERFSDLRTLVLDEADTMLEAGFLLSIKETLRRLPPKRESWQGMCFSATVPEKIKDVLKFVLNPGYTHLSTVDKNEIPTVDNVPQFHLVIPSVQDTFAALLNLIRHEHAQSVSNNIPFKIIVFGVTANTIAHLYHTFSNLPDLGVNVYQLQSRLSQNVRTRTTNEFKEADSGVMFASDVIGRGMDFPNVSHVIQVGLPSNAEQYVHRVGRTARAGNSGRAIILLTEAEAYFVHTNRKLPLKPYPNSISMDAEAGLDDALNAVNLSVRRKAYQAWLGFHKTYMKNLRTDPRGVVQMANDFAEAMRCPETPMIDKKVVGKMGLKGVQGLRVGVVKDEDEDGGGKASKPAARPARKPASNGVVKSYANVAPSSTAEQKPASGGGRGGRGGRGRGRRGHRGGRGGQSTGAT